MSERRLSLVPRPRTTGYRAQIARLIGSASDVWHVMVPLPYVIALSLVFSVGLRSSTDALDYLEHIESLGWPACLLMIVFTILLGVVLRKMRRRKVLETAVVEIVHISWFGRYVSFDCLDEDGRNITLRALSTDQMPVGDVPMWSRIRVEYQRYVLEVDSIVAYRMLRSGPGPISGKLLFASTRKKYTDAARRNGQERAARGVLRELQRRI